MLTAACPQGTGCRRGNSMPDRWDLAQFPLCAVRRAVANGTYGDFVRHFIVRIAFLNELLSRELEDLFQGWGVVYHFESASFTISPIAQMWALTPAAIAGVVGYGLANVLWGLAKL